jgi:hypothetical protein
MIGNNFELWNPLDKRQEARGKTDEIIIIKGN